MRTLINVKNAVLVCALAYVLLCLLHLFSLRPLWLDENFVFNSIKQLSPQQIFGRLTNTQVFPRLYLFLIQGISSIFNYNIISLRILPFAAMILSFFLWMKIYREEEGMDWGYLLFILSWCGSYSLTYYSAELKQYSCDVMVAALFTFFILKQRKSVSPPDFTLWYIFLPFLVLFSYTGYFFILVPLYNLVLSLREDKKNLRYLIIYFAVIVMAVTISYILDIKYTRAEKGVFAGWDSYFISTSSFEGFIDTFTEGIRNIFTRWFLNFKAMRHLMVIFLPFGLFAMFYNGIMRFKKDKGYIFYLDTIALFLFLSLMLAGLLKIYPFTGIRVTLYIAPFIFYSIIKGMKFFKSKTRFVYYAFFSLYALILTAFSSYLFYHYLSLYKKL